MLLSYLAKKSFRIFLFFIFSGNFLISAYCAGEPKQLNIIVIFAHPDDADSRMSGTAALFAKMGAAVKFVSLTNGDAGSYNEGGGPLGKRRRE